EDGNENKGKSTLTIPLRPEKDGRYRIEMVWRKNAAEGTTDRRGRRRVPVANAKNVLVEVFSHDRNHLALPPLPEVPPAGEARFTIDQTLDNIAFWDLKTAFRFAKEGDGVEINNAGTRRRVVADAIKFQPVDGGPAILIDNDEADGHESWPVFKEYAFKP